MKPFCRLFWVALLLSSLALSASAQGNSNESIPSGSQPPASAGAPGSQPAGSTGTEPGKETQQPDTAPSFDVVTEKIDIAMMTWQPQNMLIHLRNTGKIRLEKLTIAGVLADGENKHHINMLIRDVPLGIEQGQEKVIEIGPNLPKQILAGTYTGALRLSADNSPAKSLTTTLRARGPVLSGLYAIPFLTFLLVLMVGYWVSSVLDKWFGLGGLKRAESILSLRQIEKGSKEILNGIERLKKLDPAGADKIVPLQLRVETNLEETEERLAGIGDLSLEELEKEINRLLLTYKQNSILWSRIEMVLHHWPTPADPIRLAKLDKLAQAPRTSDLDAYREALLRIIESTEGEPADAVSSMADDIVRADSNQKQKETAEENIKAKIKRMNRVLLITLCVVVFFGAYMIFYSQKFDFGTLADYISVFLWTLGLTQTGKKVLERATSSYTPKA